jgi:thymidylate kinase
MLIEIAGIPGSGKTTLYKRLGKELKRRGVAYTDANTIAIQRSGAENAPRFVRSRPERDLLFRFTRFTAKNPDFFTKVESSFGDATTVKFLFFLLCANFQMARDLRKKGEMVFMDEAFLTHCIAIHSRESRRSDLSGLLGCAPRIDAVIFIDIPPDVAFGRVVERAGGTPEKRAGVIQKIGEVDVFAQRRDWFRAGVEAYKERCSRIFVIEATQDTDEDVKQLADDLMELSALLGN